MGLTPMEHDGRLRLVKIGQYRMWHDSQDIQIPLGQSTTKPLNTEKANANVQVYGEIHNGFFQRPLVDITNTFPAVKRFDAFELAIWRRFDPDNPDGENGGLPYNDPTIDYHYDLGLTRIHTAVEIAFAAGGFTGAFSGNVEFSWQDGSNWQSGQLHFANFSLQELFGNFALFINPESGQTATGQSFTTGQFAQAVNLPITAIVGRANIKNGNASMPLLLQNESEWPLTLTTANVTVIGGE